MSLIKSREQKKAMRAIEIMFQGLDDDLLKQTLLTIHAGADPAILEAMKEQEQKDMEEMLKEMELQSVEEVFEVKQEKSNDIVDGNSRCDDPINQGHSSSSLEQSN